MMTDEEWLAHDAADRRWAIEQALAHGAPDTQVGARYLLAVLDGTWQPEPEPVVDLGPELTQRGWKATRGL